MRWIAFIWGFLEATFFFIVPDVYLTRIGIKSFRTALTALIYASFGAVLGGILVNGIGTMFYAQGASFMNGIPAISTELIGNVLSAVNTSPYTALLFGASKGIPYKLYALSFGFLNISFFNFICISILARSLRFFLTISLAWLISSTLRQLSLSEKYQINYSIWVIFYVVYFLLMAN